MKNLHLYLLIALLGFGCGRGEKKNACNRLLNFIGFNNKNNNNPDANDYQDEEKVNGGDDNKLFDNNDKKYENDNEWECKKCTFKNNIYNDKCEICGDTVPSSIVLKNTLFDEKEKQELSNTAKANISYDNISAKLKGLYRLGAQKERLEILKSKYDLQLNQEITNEETFCNKLISKYSTQNLKWDNWKKQNNKNDINSYNEFMIADDQGPYNDSRCKSIFDNIISIVQNSATILDMLLTQLPKNNALKNEYIANYNYGVFIKTGIQFLDCKARQYDWNHCVSNRFSSKISSMEFANNETREFFFKLLNIGYINYEHFLALAIYCNRMGPQQEYKSTFTYASPKDRYRLKDKYMIWHTTLKDLYQRIQFYRDNYELFINKFGYLPKAPELPKELCLGASRVNVNETFIDLQNRNIKYYGPLSTTVLDNSDLAKKYATSSGVVIYLYKPLNCIDVAWLSAYPNEREIMLFNSDFQISDCEYELEHHKNIHKRDY